MPDLHIDGFRASIKRFFFDRQAVQAGMDRVSHRYLSGLGAFVRTSARSLLRSRKRTSAPGEPPSIHSRDPVATLRNVQFAYDPRMRSVVIGPMPLNQHYLQAPLSSDHPDVASGEWMRLKRGVVPNVLEHGGVVGFRESMDAKGQWRKIGWRKRLKDRLIPIWRATHEQLRQSTGRHLLRRGKRTLTFIVVPGAVKTRIRWAKIAARPFMRPAAVKGLAEWRARFGRPRTGSRAA